MKNLSVVVPDTITTWKTEAFCLSPRGFGLAPQRQITIFQPFFLDLTLPYSIIRGEQFELKATTFNYLSSCIMVMSVFKSPTCDCQHTNVLTAMLRNSCCHSASWRVDHVWRVISKPNLELDFEGFWSCIKLAIYLNTKLLTNLTNCNFGVLDCSVENGCLCFLSWNFGNEPPLVHNAFLGFMAFVRGQMAQSLWTRKCRGLV